MKKFILPFLFILSCYSLSAQSERTIVRKQQQPLIIVDSVETDASHMLLKPDRIQSLDVINDSAAFAQYGEKGRYGAIIIRTKRNVEVANLNELLANIPQSDKNLKIALDNILVKDTSKLVIDKQDIKKVEVVNDILWYSAMQPGNEERYINISTKK